MLHDKDDCDICIAAENPALALMEIVVFEKEMAQVRTQDEGIYEPRLTSLWLAELASSDLRDKVKEEHDKYYKDDPDA